jgi:hypothetical protein
MSVEQKQLLNQVDAFVLTFAYPVARGATQNRISRAEAAPLRIKSPLSTIKRFAKNKTSGPGFETKIKLI